MQYFFFIHYCSFFLHMDQTYDVNITMRRNLLYLLVLPPFCNVQSIYIHIFTSHATKETFRMNHHFNCNRKCLIYLFSCKMCGKQYVELTTDEFRYRWNNYKNCQCKAERGEDHTHKYLHDHFLNEDHDGLLNNVEITLTDNTDPSVPEKTEEFWRTKLRTLAPLGLNFE